MEEQKDEKLWRMAKKRASFKQNLASYLIINALLWGIWWYTQGRHSRNMDWPWPLWVMIFWGMGVIFNYLDAYRGDKETMAEKEYEKLKKQQDKS